ncbi:MAG: hypothetical protein K2O32_11240, partial [Acetatifactor sp.]|nr:hypothetical protein [Acetatifactor sp.]
MFEELNMTKKLKRQISKAVSIALSAAMLVTGLPADVPGGLASVKAADVEASSKVVYSQGEWTSGADDKLIRTTKWDFNTGVLGKKDDGSLDEGPVNVLLSNG